MLERYAHVAEEELALLQYLLQQVLAVARGTLAGQPASVAIESPASHALDILRTVQARTNPDGGETAPVT